MKVSKYRFSKNKEYNAMVIREMLAYLRASFRVVNLPNDEIISTEEIESFAARVQGGEIL